MNELTFTQLLIITTFLIPSYHFAKIEIKLSSIRAKQTKILGMVKAKE